ncbi:MAG TPA: hypothetical protein VF247_03205 [Candidatus Krumholzibacteria bacterium]
MPVLTERCARVYCLLLLALCLFAPSAGRAQSAERATEFEDLGLTRPTEVSARSLGVSGAVPVNEDVTALVYNPAGLCRIKKRSGLLGFTHDANEITSDHGSGASSLSSSRNGLLFAGGVIPLPMFRGSLVPAVAVHRMFVSDFDIGYRAADGIDGRDDEFRLQQAGATYAFAVGFGVDLASVLSAGLSMSVFEGGYQALRQSHTHTDTGTAVDRYVIDDIDGDLDGVVGRLGLTLFAHRHLHVAFNVETPTLVNTSASQATEITEVVENSTGSTTRTSSSTTTEYIVPYRIDGGIEIPWGNWLVTAQAGTCDWSQAAIDKNSLHLENTDAVLGRTVDIRAGVEWTSSQWPLRLRAGAARLPFASDYVQADRIDNDRLEEVHDESAPLRFSLGAGVALKNTILIDAAFSHTRGDRRSATVSQEHTSSQLVIEGSYWF